MSQSKGNWAVWFSRRWPLAGLLLLALVLRLVAMRWSGDPIGADEIGYLSDGLLLAEGLVPAYKASPSAPLTWFSTIVVWCTTLVEFLRPPVEIAALPVIDRAMLALDAALFRYYADFTGLRLAAVLVFLPVTLAAVVLLYHSGARHGGTWVALAVGAVGACLPPFIEYAVQSRPYAPAWALGIVAVCLASVGRGRMRTIGAGIALGLAVANRIDMAAAAPLVLLAFWRRPGIGFIPAAVTTGVTTAITFLIVAPWYLPHLIGNIRVILAIRLAPQAPTTAPSAIENMLDGGVLILLALAILGLVLATRRTRWADWVALAFLLAISGAAMRPSTHGLRHDGVLLVTVVSLLPLALQNIRWRMRTAWRPAGSWALVGVVAAPVLLLGVWKAIGMGSEGYRDDALTWAEANVPAGSVLLVRDRLDMPLPTAQASETLWNDVASPDAWRRKMAGPSARRFVGDGARVPIALSDEHMYLDRGIRRRFFILGEEQWSRRPRYDLRLVSDGTIFDMSTPAAIDYLCANGGTYLHNGFPLKRLGEPVTRWVKADGRGTYVYKVVPKDCLPP